MPGTTRQSLLKLSQLGIWAILIWPTYLVRQAPCGMISFDLHTWFYGMIGFISLSYVAIFLRFPRNADKKRGWHFVVAVLLMCASAFLLLQNVAPLGPFGFFFGCFIGALGYISLFFRWLRYFALLDFRQSLACILIASLIDRVVFGALGFVPARAALVVLVLLSLYATASLWLSIRLTAQEHSLSEVYYESQNLFDFKNTMIGIMTYGLVLGMRKGLELSVTNPYINILCQGISIFVLLAVLVWMVGLRRHIDFSRAFQALLILFATVFSLYPFAQGSFAGIIKSMFIVSVGLVFTLMVCAVVNVARHSNLHPNVIFGGVWALYSIPRPLGAVISDGLNNVPAPSYSITLSLLVVYTIVVCSAFLLGRRTGGQKPIWSELYNAPRPNDFSVIDEKCRELGKAHKLTPREIEIAQYLCKGRSKGYIAETLFISENTVGSHSRNIYSKLGIHNKQELIDLIDYENLEPQNGK